MKKWMNLMMVSCAAVQVFAQEIQDTTERTYLVRTTYPTRASIAESVIQTGSIESPAVVDLMPKVSGRLMSTTLTNGIEITEGTVVKAGEVLARIDSRDYAARVLSAESRLASARATLVDAQKEHARTEALLKENTATEQEADRAEAALKRAEAGVGEAEAALTLAQLDLEATEIKAPMDCRVANKNLFPGAMLNAGSVIYRLVSMDELRIFFEVPTTRFAKIQPGKTEVTVVVDAYPDEALKLKVFSIHPAANERTRTVRVELRLPNAEGKYLPGMYVKGELALNQRDDALVVPHDCLVPMVGKTIVYEVVDGHAIAREVKLGIRDDARQEILEGLSDKAEIVSVGTHRLTNGVAVKIDREDAQQ